MTTEEAMIHYNKGVEDAKEIERKVFIKLALVLIFLTMFISFFLGFWFGKKYGNKDTRFGHPVIECNDKFYICK